MIEGYTGSKKFSFWRLLNGVMLLGILVLLLKQEFIAPKGAVSQTVLNLTPAQLDQIKTAVRLPVNLDPVIAKMTELHSKAPVENFDVFMNALTEGVKIESGGKETTYKLKVVERPGEARLLQLVAEQ